jgi:hypothetical protein
MRMHLRPLAAALALAAAPARAAPPRLAVVTLDAPPQLQFTGRSVAEAIAKQAAGADVEVLGPAEVAEQLGPAAHAQLVRCADDPRCLARNGARLRVDRLVGGRLERRGAAYRVALVHADAATGLRLGGVEREIPVASRRLQRDVASAAPELFSGDGNATGVLEVVTDVPGAEVEVDGMPAGRTPLVRAVRPGRHRVKVSGEGCADAEPTWVDVPAHGAVEHRPRLYAIPARDRQNPSPTEGHGTAVQVSK